jgi:hypothetical protein
MCHPPLAGGGCAKRSSARAALIRPTDRVLHRLEATVFETAGGCGDGGGIIKKEIYLFMYKKNDQGGVTVMEYTGKDATAVIPAKINGLPVTEIESMAFYGRTDLTVVAIPRSVTKIGDCAFWGCSGLTVVEIPSSVTEIGFGAFLGYAGNPSVQYPPSAAIIKSLMFS